MLRDREKLHLSMVYRLTMGMRDTRPFSGAGFPRARNCSLSSAAIHAMMFFMTLAVILGSLAL